MTQPFFMDGSHWNTVYDWNIMLQHTAAAMWKATEGTGFVDNTFETAKSQCMDYGEPWGAYHFFHPDMSPTLQAHHFINTVGGNCSVYVADIETAVLAGAFGGTIPEGARGREVLSLKIADAVNAYSRIASSNNIAIVVKEFLDNIKALVGYTPIIYTSPGFWNYYLAPTPSWCSEYPLWVAHYGVSQPRLPNGWTSHRMWQYTDSESVPGVSGAVDGNLFNGSSDDLISFFDNGSTPPPFSYEKAVVVADNGVKVRSLPTTLSSYYFVLRKGSIVEVLERIDKESGDIWLRVGQRQYCAMTYNNEVIMQWL